MNKEDKKIIVRKKRKKAVPYNESTHGYGNTLPEAEVVGYTGSPAVQKLKKMLDERKKKISTTKQKVSSLRERMEERQNRRKK